MAVYTVNIAGDAGTVCIGQGSGTSGDLRYCLNKAILDQQADTITFASSLSGQTIQLAAFANGFYGQITPANNPVNVYGDSSFFVGTGDNITVDGTNAPGVKINGNGIGRLFTVFGGSLTLVNLQLSGGVATGGNGAYGGGGGGAGAGGAVFVDGASFTAKGVTFSNDKAVGGNGGAGAYNGGSVYGGGGGGGGLGAPGGNRVGDTGGNGAGANGGRGILLGRLPGNKNGYHDVLGHLSQSHTINAGGFGGGGGGGGRSSYKLVTNGRSSYTAAALFKVNFGDNKTLGSGTKVYVGGSGANGGFGGGGGGVGAGQNNSRGLKIRGLVIRNAEIAGIGGYGGGGGGENVLTGVNINGVQYTNLSNGGFGGGAGAALKSNNSNHLSNFEAGGGGGGAGFGGAVFSNGGTLTLDRDTFTGNTALGGFGGAATGPNVFPGRGGGGLGGAVFAVNGSVDVRRSSASGDKALGATSTGSTYSDPQPSADFYFDARKAQGVKGNGTINAAVNFTSDAGALSIAGSSYTTLQSVPFQLESGTQLAYTGQHQPATVYVGNSRFFISALDGVAPTLTYAQANDNGSFTNLGSTAPVSAGNYVVTATFPDTAHYLAGQAKFTFSITKVSPQLSVTDAGGAASFTNGFPATATVTGVNGVASSSLEGVTPTITYSSAGGGNFGATAPNSPGNYTATATFAGSANYTAATATTNFTLTAEPQSTVVTTALDENNGSSNPALGTGTSLREAINYAESLYNSFFVISTITFAPSLLGQTINLSLGPISLTGGITIDGPGLTQLTISGNNTSEIFCVASGAANVTMSGLSLINGNAGSNGGGAIYNAGRLNLTSCYFTNDKGTYGGAIDNQSALYMNSCELDYNTATITGGGLYTVSGGATGTVPSSNLIADNAAPTGPDVDGAVSSGGYNIVTNGTASSGWISTDKIGYPVMLTGRTPLVRAFANSEVANGLPYSSTSVTVQDPFTQSSVTGAGTISLAYYAGNLTASQVSTATPLSTPPSAFGSYTVVATFTSNSSTYVTASGTPTYFSIATSTLVVDTTSDENDGNFASGHFSLREAIQLADTASNLTITFAPALSGQQIVLTSELPVINVPTTIQGPGANLLSVSMSKGAQAAFLDAASAGVVISGLTFTGESNSQYGIMIGQKDSLSMTGCGITSFSNLYGALVQNQGTVSFSGCTIADNTNVQSGLVDSGTSGAGNAATINIINSTLTANTLSTTGSLIDNVSVYGPVNIINSTIVGNGGNGNVGAAVTDEHNATTNFGNTIVAGNLFSTLGSSADVSGIFSSLGGNLIGQTDGSSGWIASDQTGSVASPLNPKLGSLANNGGPTQTMLPLAGSPAWNGGVNSVAVDPATGLPLTTDQRGLPRFNGTVDVGSVEAVPSTTALLTTASPGTVAVGATTTLTASTTITGASNLSGTLTFQLYTSASATLVDTETVTVNGSGTYSTPTGYTPPAPGALGGGYQWSVSFTSSVNYNASITNQEDATGLVSVTPANPTITGAPSSTSVQLSTTPITLTDAVTLSGAYHPNGLIYFALYEGSTLVDVESVYATSNGTYTTPNGYTLPTAGAVSGTYQWQVAYASGTSPQTTDLNNNSAYDSFDPAEQVTVLPANPTITNSPNTTVITFASPTTLTDTATLANAFYPTGTLTFTLYTNAGGTVSAVDTETVSVNGNGTYATTAGYTIPATGATAGGYVWTATYNADSNNSLVSASSPLITATVHPTLSATTASTQYNNTPYAISVTAVSGSNPIDSVSSITTSGVMGDFTIQFYAGPTTASPTASSAQKNAGTYAYTVTYAGDNYYTPLITQTFTYTITPATITIAAVTQTKVKGATDPTLIYTTGSFAAGDTAATVLSGTLSRVPGEQIGYYAISQGSLAANSNYTTQFTGSVLGITSNIVTTSDGAHWYLGPDGTANAYEVFRALTGQSPVWMGGGLGQFIGQAEDGTVLIENSSRSIYSATGSNTGKFTGYQQLLNTVTAGDNATWFLGTDSNGGGNLVYRFSTAGELAYTNGAAVTLFTENGSVYAQNAGGTYYENIGSNTGLGTWQQLISSISVSTNALNMGSTTVGTASASQPFTVGASYLSSNEILTAPAGVELSADNGGSWQTVETLNIVSVDGSLQTTPLLARLSANAPSGAFTGSISVSGGGASEQDITVSGLVKAVPTLTVTDASGTYNNTAFTAKAMLNGQSMLEGVSPTLTYYAGSSASGTALSGAPSIAGTYTVVATFAGSTNYAPASTQTTFVIAKYQPVISVVAAGGAYTGSVYNATAAVKGINGISVSSLEGISPTFVYYVGSTATGPASSIAPSGVGTYTVVATFGGSTDYSTVTATTTFQINSALRDVTSQIKTARGGYVYNTKTKTYSQTLTITNTGSALLGNLSLVFTGLTGGTLANGTGITTSVNSLSPVGSSYLTLSIASLPAGASVSIVLQFSAVSPPAYSVQWLSGAGQL